MLEQFVYVTIISSLTAATIVLMLHKLGAVEYMQLHGRSFINKLASCSFCMGAWCLILISIIIAIFTKDLTMLLIPIPGAALTRALI